MNIVLFGSPGAGKGTQADKLAQEFNLYKISTGDLLRIEIKKGTSIGNKIEAIINKGQLVSDNTINSLIENIISNKSFFNRIVFDGYPRNLHQAKNLDDILEKYKQKISLVLNLQVSEENIIKRILGRRICSKCGLIFNDFFNPASKDSHNCGTSFLEKRPDDNEKIIKSRYRTYTEQTLPILNYYRKQNLLTEIDGNKQIDEIYKEIRQFIAPLET